MSNKTEKDLENQKNSTIDGTNEIGEVVSKYGLSFGSRGVYDTRNRLNDLTGKEWLQLTKSVWISERDAADKIAFDHPAPFLVRDIEKLISLFTKNGDLVLDPFAGSGTTLLASARLRRNCIGIELSEEYVKDLIIPRIKYFSENNESVQLGLFKKFEENIFEEFINKRHNDKKIIKDRKKFYAIKEDENDSFVLDTPYDTKQIILVGDSLKRLDEIPIIDYCVTSPPYHNILKNKGNGVRHDGSQTRQGVDYYSEKPNDLGNFDDYTDYLSVFKEIMLKVFKKLGKGNYCSVIISDFTIERNETSVHSDVTKLMTEEIGFNFMGNTILVQDSKPLYPFGYPYQYRINHVHQYILNFLKE